MKILRKIGELVGPQGATGSTNEMPEPAQPRPEYASAAAPLMGSIPRPPLRIDFPQDSNPRMPVTWTRPQPTTSADTGYSQQPGDHVELPSGHVTPSTTGPDPRLPSQGKVFGTPPVYTIPPRGGRLQLTPRREIPDE